MTKLRGGTGALHSIVAGVSAQSVGMSAGAKRLRELMMPGRRIEATKQNGGASDKVLLDELLGELAAWCDKELREAATVHIDSIPGVECENSEMNKIKLF